MLFYQRQQTDAMNYPTVFSEIAKIISLICFNFWNFYRLAFDVTRLPTLQLSSVKTLITGTSHFLQVRLPGKVTFTDCDCFLQDDWNEAVKLPDKPKYLVFSQNW